MDPEFGPKSTLAGSFSSRSEGCFAYESRPIRYWAQPLPQPAEECFALVVAQFIGPRQRRDSMNRVTTTMKQLLSTSLWRGWPTIGKILIFVMTKYMSGTQEEFFVI